MLRRVFLLFILIAVLAVATAPWTTSSGRIRIAAMRQIKALTGLDLEIGGRVTLAVLPVPRVKFRDVTLTDEKGVVVLTGGQLRGELRLLPLLAARVEMTEIAVNAARVTVAIDEAGDSPWNTMLKALRVDARDGETAQTPIRKLTVTGTEIVIRDARHHVETSISGLNLVAAWPSRAAPIDVSAAFAWKGDAVTLTLNDITPASLLSGLASRYTLTGKASGGSFSASGELRTEPAFQASGQTSIATDSLRDFVRWSGMPLPLGERFPAFGLTGAFTANANEISWPNVQLTLGRDRLDGALSYLRENGRPLLRATLAGNQVDLWPLLAPFRTAYGENGTWADDPFAPRLASAGNIDLRLSAATATLGALKLDEVAAALLMTDSRLEFSLARAGLDRGTLKGRMALGIASGFFDFKAQGSFDKIDVAPLFAAIGQSRWLSGAAQGQFAVESFGESPADLVRQINGRAGLTIRQGEITGVALDDVMRRAERRQLAAAFDWRGGRTSFDQAVVGLNVGRGVAEIVDGTVTGGTFRTQLEGSISLAERTMAVKAVTEGGTPSAAPAPIVFDIRGPWRDLGVAPDFEAPIRRSDAGRQNLAR